MGARHQVLLEGLPFFALRIWILKNQQQHNTNLNLQEEIISQADESLEIAAE